MEGVREIDFELFKPDFFLNLKQFHFFLFLFNKNPHLLFPTSSVSLIVGLRKKKCKHLL